jgi:hypothetical protein
VKDLQALLFEFFPQPDLALPSLPQGLERRGLLLDLPVFPPQRLPLPRYDLPESLGLLLVVLGIRYRPPRETPLHVQEGLCVPPDAESSIDSEHWQTSPFLYNAAILQFGHKATGLRAQCQRLHPSVPAPERVVCPLRLANPQASTEIESVPWPYGGPHPPMAPSYIRNSGAKNLRNSISYSSERENERSGEVFAEPTSTSSPTFSHRNSTNRSRRS